jgi:hypothetical protein
VKLLDGGIGREPVLINAKSRWIREVVAELAVELENIAVIRVADDWNLGL